MKLKLKLILASMFFCSLIFAQSNAPNIQFRQDRVQNVEKKKTSKMAVPEKKVATKLFSKNHQEKVMEVAPPHNRSIVQTEKTPVTKDLNKTSIANSQNDFQAKVMKVTPPHNRSIQTENKPITNDLNRSVAKAKLKVSPYSQKQQQIYTENKAVLDQMKINDVAQYQAFLVDLQTLELSELKSLYNLK